MNDLEISKALALAIGWKPEQMRDNRLRKGELLVQSGDEYFARPFSYTDWNVIGPIAERYDCFPSRNGFSQTWWPPQVVRGKDVGHIMEDTPQKAIAMAVIGAAK